MTIISGLYHVHPYMVFMILISLILSIVNVILFLGIIWYERFGSDNRRTLLNKLVSSVSSRVIQWMLICQVGDMARYTVGPLPVPFCGFLTMAKTSLRFQVRKL